MKYFQKNLRILIVGIAFPICIQAQTQHDTAVYENELVSGSATSTSSQTSSTGANISVSDGTFSSQAFVDQAISTTAPTLRVKTAGSTTGAYNDSENTKTSTAIAQTTTIFTATSGTQPFETSFNAGFDFNIDGTITFDVGTPSPSDLSPFRYGDQGRSSFTLAIRPESDEYSATAPAISFSSEIYWDDTGAHTGDVNIYDGESNILGAATINITDNSATEKYFTVSGNVPFSALVGVEYRMEAYFQAGTRIRGGTGDKSIEVDFFNSMNAAPVSEAGGDYGFSVIPELSSLSLALVAFLGTFGFCLRRNKSIKK